MNFQFSGLSEFIWMDGHGPYVWGAYVLTLLGLLGLIINHKVSSKSFFKTQAAIAKRKQNEPKS